MKELNVASEEVLSRSSPPKLDSRLRDQVNRRIAYKVNSKQTKRLMTLLEIIRSTLVLQNNAIEFN